MRFAACNCPVGMKYHALNCPTKPGQPQNLPEWMKAAIRRGHDIRGTKSAAQMEHLEGQ